MVISHYRAAEVLQKFFKSNSAGIFALQNAGYIWEDFSSFVIRRSWGVCGADEESGS